MSNVEFQEEERGRVRGEKVSAITKLLMKMGVKDEKQANKVMLGIVVFCVLLTIIILWVNKVPTNNQEMSPEVLQELINIGEMTP
ncbi:hypothetical protein A2442_03460 [Candidatus Campbellbacteria bacterium RIFOXYC2_FULL_35_25]|uniref:Uncharacterized protein n=1 Tax=Candidatus Campbellbacteria bacterium RIFOXYC2_FULL_35_25 TaxID=1797582 RepID=A0A1F5EI81_9BACT|nr:MAG: hypothetical protein A2442_03460 [Candidatus Campbellbacteria bacterium RIFOXYC2_FULL_35_25]